MMEDAPIPAVHGVARWRLEDLAQWIFEEFGITLDETSVGRTLKAINIMLLASPAHSLEIISVDNVWQILHENRLSNRLFKS